MNNDRTKELERLIKDVARKREELSKLSEKIHQLSIESNEITPV